MWGMASQTVLLRTRQRRLRGIQLIIKSQYQIIAGSMGRMGFPLAATASSAPRNVVKKERFTAKKI